MPWPPGGPNVCALVEETRWPIAAATVDRLIVAHGLETCESPDALLPEIWRVLAPGGRVVFIVPNRSGLWARRDVTPFGYGRPYSLGQLEALARRHRFAPERHVGALYAPPSHRRFWLQTAHALGAARPALRPAARRRRAARRGVEAGLRPARRAARRPRCAARSRCSRASPDRSPSRSPDMAAAGSAAPQRAEPGAASMRRSVGAAIGVLPRPGASAITAPISRAREPACRQDSHAHARGGPWSEQRKGAGVQLSIFDIGGRRSLRDGALRDREGRKAPRRGRARTSASSRRSSPTAPTSARCSPRRSTRARSRARPSPRSPPRWASARP